MPIELHILVGSDAGRRLVLDGPAVTIGRGADNGVVIDLPYVSRLHAELREGDGQWELVNHSPNGTRLDGRMVTKRPRALKGPANVAIGDQTVLQVTPLPGGGGAGPAAATATTAAATDGEAPPAVASGLSRRAKIWIGIGVYMLVMLGLIVFFSTLGAGQEGAAEPTTPELTAAEIEAEIQRPVPAEPPDERRARAALEEANELFNLRDTALETPYRAYEAYREALAYLPGQRFPDPADRRRYQVLQQELTEAVTRRYQSAYNLLRSRQYDLADEAFAELLRIYPAGKDSRIFRNAQAHWAAARAALERRR